MDCQRCGRGFPSDHTSMADDGYCMMCRPAIGVTCARCGEPCPGAFDGQKRCPACRSARRGEQQYEDKQRTLYAKLVASGQILMAPHPASDPV